MPNTRSLVTLFILKNNAHNEFKRLLFFQSVIQFRYYCRRIISKKLQFPSCSFIPNVKLICKAIIRLVKSHTSLFKDFLKANFLHLAHSRNAAFPQLNVWICYDVYNGIVGSEAQWVKASFLRRP